MGESAGRTVSSRDLLDRLIAYEEGWLSEPETVQLFQQLIDAQLVEMLQGSYGRMAQALIEAGRCTCKGTTPGGPPACRTTEEKSRAR